MGIRIPCILWLNVTLHSFVRSKLKDNRHYKQPLYCKNPETSARIVSVEYVYELNNIFIKKNKVFPLSYFFVSLID